MTSSKGKGSTSLLYLDYNGTTPVDPQVLHTMLPFLRAECGNPSSSHILGKRAAAAVYKARCDVANALNASEDEIFFTCGATESINWAMKCGALKLSFLREKKKIVTSVMDHPAVHAACSYLQEQHQVEIVYAPVDCYGIIDLNALREVLTDEVCLVSAPHGNGEVGSLQPVSQIKELMRICCPDALFHVDASQTFGKITVNVQEIGADLLTLAGHKVYAPKGVGALYIKTKVELLPFIHGGGQERGRRGGTESVPNIVAFGEASRLAVLSSKGLLHVLPENDLNYLSQSFERMDSNSIDNHINGEMCEKSVNQPCLLNIRQLSMTLLNTFWNCLCKLTEMDRSALKGFVRMNGPVSSENVLEKWLWSTINISVRGVHGYELARRLEDRGILVSAGVTCHQGGSSPVLVAMGAKPEWASAIRISPGRYTSFNDCERAGKILADVVNEYIRLE